MNFPKTSNYKKYVSATARKKISNVKKIHRKTILLKLELKVFILIV